MGLEVEALKEIPYLSYLFEPLGYGLDPQDPVDSFILNEGAFSHSEGSSEAFLKAMVTAYRRQMENFPAYEAAVERLRKEGKARYPDEIHTEEELRYIPSISVYALKRFEFKGRLDNEIVLTLYSSGTSGYKSKIKLNPKSLRRVRKIAFNVYGAYGLVDLENEYNYIGFTYDPSKAKNVGTAFTDVLLATFTKVRKVFWALRYDEARGDFFFDLEGVLKALEEYNREGLPIRVLGFPAYLWFTLEEVEKRYPKGYFGFGERSFILPGGGWKTLSDKEIPKPVFRAKVEELLGIPGRNMRDLYGMVEHGVPYVECEDGIFHVPIYSRVYSVDPLSGEHLQEGEPGLFKLLTPYIESYPSISVLSTDLGTVTSGRCSCGRSTPRLKLLGRAGKFNVKGCALQALELLTREF